MPSFSGRLRQGLKLITVEPILMSFITGLLLGRPALHNLKLEKSCRNDCGYNDTVCNAIIDGQGHLYPEELLQVQALISEMQAWNKPLQSVVPIILILFLSSYSDRRHIRKPFILLPVLAEIIYGVSFILNVIYMKEWSLNIFGVCKSLIPSLFGDTIMMDVAISSYIADISTKEARTLRMILPLIMINCCDPIINSFNAHLFKLIGYIPIACISITFHIAAIVYGIFVVKEPRPKVPRDPNVCVLTDIFNPAHLISSLKLPLQKVPGNNLLLIWGVMILSILVSGQLAAENDLYFLYTNLKFGYTVVEFSIFLLFSNLVNLKGSIIVIPIFNKWLKLTDYSVLVVILCFKVVSNIVLALAEVPFVFFVGTYIGLFTVVTSTVLRSVGSKITRNDDIGKGQAILGICEALGPTLLVPIYDRGIYFRTISTFPNAFLLAGTVLGPLCIIIVLFLNYKSKRIDCTNENGQIYEKVADSLKEAIRSENNREQLESAEMRSKDDIKPFDYTNP